MIPFYSCSAPLIRDSKITLEIDYAVVLGQDSRTCIRYRFFTVPYSIKK